LPKNPLAAVEIEAFSLARIYQIHRDALARLVLNKNGKSFISISRLAGNPGQTLFMSLGNASLALSLKLGFRAMRQPTKERRRP